MNCLDVKYKIFVYMCTWIKRHLSFVVFFIIVAICTCITLFAELRISSTFAKEQKQIVQNYDALLSVISSRATDGIPALDSMLNAVGCDSIQEVALRDAYKRYVLSQTEKAIVDRTAQSTRLVMEVRDILDRQLAKIQQEYETLEVWCGIITVVFLIFSFYSLFKVEDIVNQGKSGLKELEVMSEKGNGKINDFIKETQTKTAQTILAAANKMNVQKAEFIEAATEEAKSKIDEVSKSFEQTMSSYISTVDTKAGDFDLSLNDKYKEFEQKYTQYRDSLDDLKKNVDVLKMKLDSLAGSVEVIPPANVKDSEKKKKQTRKKIS